MSRGFSLRGRLLRRLALLLSVILLLSSLSAYWSARRAADEERDAAERDAAARRQEAEAVYEEQRANAAKAAADFETTLAERRQRTAAEFQEQQAASQAKLDAMAAEVEDLRAAIQRQQEEADAAARRSVMKASARADRGQGNAAATITSVLTPDGDGTRVTVETELNVTGPLAQFGRGVMQDVSAKLMEQFAACLAAELSEEPSAAAPAQSDVLDVGAVGGGAVLKRAAPVLALLALIGLVLAWRRRRG